MKVVVDTNVLVSGILNPLGFPGQIVELIIDESVTPIVSDAILSEYREVLLSQRLSLSRPDVRLLFTSIERSCELVHPAPSRVRLVDPDDQCFLDASEEAGNATIITGNLKHFKGVSQAISPRIFIETFISE